MADSVQFVYNGKTEEFPLISGTLGPKAVNIGELYKKMDIFTYDPAFMSTASCISDITFIDGEEGILIYRGKQIADLSESMNFLSTAYLLINNEVPNAEQYKSFHDKIIKNMNIEPEIVQIITSFPRNAHPMAILMGALSGLAAIYHDNKDILPDDQKNCDEFIYKIIAKAPTLVASIYRHVSGKKILDPKPDLGYSENFLYMTFANDDNYIVNETIAKALDVIFILHADHEQNASTSTVRMSGSSGTNPFAAIAAGVATLWGPSHGGANEAVIKMLEEIAIDGDIPKCIENIKNKTFKLMGFGHRVYKNYDPRAKILKQQCDNVLEALNLQDDKLLAIAKNLESIALNDEYFKSRKLYPNVDFYSGIICQAIGIPTSMFTPIFALARSTGWAVQYKEMMNDDAQKIARPRQVYSGKSS